MPAGSVDSLYARIIHRYPSSPYAAEAERFLGIAPPAAIPDPAEPSYQRGEKLMLANHSRAAIDTFQSVVARYPSSRFAARAQYAVGWIYENVAGETDSAVENYKKLVALYPNSEYAAGVRLRLAPPAAPAQDSAAVSGQTPPAGQLKAPADEDSGRKRGANPPRRGGSGETPEPPSGVKP